MPGHLSHVDAAGTARMVDVGDKQESQRVAVAQGHVRCSQEAFAAVAAAETDKGDVLGTARIAGVMAAKRTSELVPMCHPLALTHVVVDLELDGDLPGVLITATVRCVARTGVEMEALTAVCVAALTVIDMAKAADRWMSVEGVGLVLKAGGRSGEVRRPQDRETSVSSPG